MSEKQWVKKLNGEMAVVLEFRGDQVTVTFCNQAMTLPIEEWRALPPWNGPTPPSLAR
jgi:hypothetical protein